jgi:hypothetical protein
LKECLLIAKEKGIEYVWADWEVGLCQVSFFAHDSVTSSPQCVPQYIKDPMVEIMRSKMYYGRARVMSVLPVFLPMKLQSLPLVVNSIFKRITDILRTRSDKGSNAAKLAGCAFGTIVKEEVLVMQATSPESGL